jgi:hypothetical protein
MLWFEQGCTGGNGWNSSDVVAVMLKSAKDRVSGVDPPRTTCATTCPVWNGLVTNYEGSGEFVLSEVRDWYSDTYETARCKRDLRV